MKTCHPQPGLKCSALLLAAILFALSAAASVPVEAAVHRIEVLMLGDVRNPPVDGFVAGLSDFGLERGRDYALQLNSAGGNRDRLADLAKNIVDKAPTLAVAAGGVEADALRAATAGTDVPVVFLAVASAIERGLVESFRSSGNNFTGVDTDDTGLTANRLWHIRKMMPSAKTVLIPVITSITPAVRAVAVAREAAPSLGFTLEIMEADDIEGIRSQAAAHGYENIDVIYIGLAAPVWQTEKELFFPVSVKHSIPIMGVNRGDLARGAVASYACSRFDTGRQAARLAVKIFNGVAPSDIPVETPEKLEFVINRWTVDRIGLKLPPRVWRLADEVVNVPVQ